MPVPVPGTTQMLNNHSLPPLSLSGNDTAIAYSVQVGLVESSFSPSLSFTLN